MTVTYRTRYDTAKSVGNRMPTVLGLRGSLYKVVWPDLFLLLTIYILLYITRIVVLCNQEHRNTFDAAIHLGYSFYSHVPITFALGFYISLVLSRWWNLFVLLPYPDNVAMLICWHIRGNDDRSRLFRRNIVRYSFLSYVFIMLMVSPQMKRRFFDVQSLVDAGLLHRHEKRTLEILNHRIPYIKYWVPIIWAVRTASKARQEGRIMDEFGYQQIIKTLASYRGDLGDILSYDWINIPLVYTQVVTMAIYFYFFGGFLGSFPKEEDLINLTIFNEILNLPWGIFFEMFIILGLVKICEALVNPFGFDDDDFEISWLVDRHFQVSFLIAEMNKDYPEVYKDKFWKIEHPKLPYPTHWTETTRQKAFNERMEELRHLAKTNMWASKKEKRLMKQFFTQCRHADPVFGRVIEKSALSDKAADHLHVINIDKLEAKVGEMLGKKDDTVPKIVPIAATQGKGGAKAVKGAPVEQVPEQPTVAPRAAATVLVRKDKIKSKIIKKRGQIQTSRLRRRYVDKKSKLGQRMRHKLAVLTVTKAIHDYRKRLYSSSSSSDEVPELESTDIKFLPKNIPNRGPRGIISEDYKSVFENLYRPRWNPAKEVPYKLPTLRQRKFTIPMRVRSVRKVPKSTAPITNRKKSGPKKTEEKKPKKE